MPFSHQGSTCSEPCSAGLWGRHCNQTCFKHCPNSDTCLRETGACICRPGFLGETCQNSKHSCLQPDINEQLPQALVHYLPHYLPECRPGTYGEQCSMPCPSCGLSYRCHHVTGKCDCLPGHTGPNCDQGCKYGLSHYKSFYVQMQLPPTKIFYRLPPRILW